MSLAENVGRGKDVFHRLTMLQTGGLPINRLLIRSKDDEPCVVAFFSDMEGDVFAVEYGTEGEIEFQVEHLSYLSLNASLLETINDFALDAADLWSALDAYWDGDGWQGWSHLISCPEI